MSAVHNVTGGEQLRGTLLPSERQDTHSWSDNIYMLNCGYIEWNFAIHSARRNGRKALVGLIPQTKLQPPKLKYETL